MSTDNPPSLLLEVEAVYDDLCPKSEDEDEPMDPDNRAEYDVTVGDHDYCTRGDTPPHDGRSSGSKSGNPGPEGDTSRVSKDKKDTAQKDTFLAPITNNNNGSLIGMPSLRNISQRNKNHLKGVQTVMFPAGYPSSQILRQIASFVSGASPAVSEPPKTLIQVEPKKTLNQLEVTKNQSHVHGKDLKQDYSKKSVSSSQSKDKQVRRERSFVSVRDRTCTHCGIVLSSLGAFRSHVHHHTNDLISCSNCPKKFGNLSQYRIHKCGKLRMCTCHICGKQFYNLVQLRIHKKKLHEDTAVDSDMDVNSKQLAASFMRKTHSKTYLNKDYECKQCGKKFREETALQRHCIMEHTNVAAYVCFSCGKKFRHRNTYRSHCRIHFANLAHVCKECGCKFSNRRRLLAHKMTHTGEKMFTCSECDNRYTEKRTLKYHMVKIHGFSPEEIGMGDAGRALCHICGLRVRRKSLKSHLSLHAGISPGNKDKKKDSTPKDRAGKDSQGQHFLCSQCGSSNFSNKQNLNRHMRKVHGDKKFKCSICSESFKYRPTLQSHMAVHTKIRAFQCDLCEKDFACHKNLRSHVQRIHETSHVCFYCKETVHGLWNIYKEHAKKCKMVN